MNELKLLLCIGVAMFGEALSVVLAQNTARTSSFDVRKFWSADDKSSIGEMVQTLLIHMC